MDIFSILWAWRWIWSIIDKFIEWAKWGKTHKQDEENKKIIRSRLRGVFDTHKIEIENIFIDLLNEMKSEVLKNENHDKKDDRSKTLLLNKIDKIKEWNLLDNIDKTGNEIENNDYIIFMWKTFFYDENIKTIESDLKINLDNFLDLYFREAKNYFLSNEKADINLLINEKWEILKLLEISIIEFEKLILVKLQGLINLSIIDSIKPTSSINDDKINNMIKNVDKFANDIKQWKMKKYYGRLQILLDKIIIDMINKIKK